MIAALVALLAGLALGTLATVEVERTPSQSRIEPPRAGAPHRLSLHRRKAVRAGAGGRAAPGAREGATLMPVYLALVPLRLSAEVPLPAEAAQALPLLEAIEQRALRAHVPVDSRIERGRTVRHALRELMEHERFERMVVAAGANGGGEGFTAEDVAWLVQHAPGELIALRPAQPTST